MIRSLLLLFALTCWLSQVGHSYASVKVGITPFPPYYSVTASGEPKGVYLEVLTKTLQAAGLNYEVESYPPKRLYNNLSNGKTDVFIGLKGSPIYHDHVIYSDTQVTRLFLRVYATGKTPLPASKEDLSGHSLGVIRGYSYGGLIRYLNDPINNIDVRSIGDHESSFRMLQKKRIDYLLNYKHPSERVLADMSFENAKYTNLLETNVYFIVSKATPGAEQLLQILEDTYQQLKDQGEFDTIHSDLMR